VGPARTGTQWKASGRTGARNFSKKITNGKKPNQNQTKNQSKRSMNLGLSEILRTDYIQDFVECGKKTSLQGA